MLIRGSGWVSLVTNPVFACSNSRLLISFKVIGVDGIFFDPYMNIGNLEFTSVELGVLDGFQKVRARK